MIHFSNKVFFITLIFLLAGCSSTKSLVKTQTDAPEAVIKNIEFKNVIFINVSGLRKDHLAWYGYNRNTMPNLERWMSNPDIFKNHFTASYIPLRAQQATLTGEYPEQNNPYKNPGISLTPEEIIIKKYDPSVLGILEKSGFQMLTNDRQNWISPISINNEEDVKGLEKRISNLKQPFFAYLGTRKLLSVNFFNPKKIKPVWADQNYKGKIPRSEEQFKKSVNTCKKNLKKCGFKEGQQELSFFKNSPFSYQYLMNIVGYKNQNDYNFLNDLYDDSLTYFDSLLNNVLVDFQKRGLLKNTLIVFTSDSGSTIFDGHKLNIGNELNRYIGQSYFLEEVVKVPLVLSYEGKESALFSETTKNKLTNSTDIAPTILNALALNEIKIGAGFSLFNEKFQRAYTHGVSKTESRGMERYSTDGEFMIVDSETRAEILMNFKTQKIYIRSEFRKYDEIIKNLKTLFVNTPLIQN